MNAPVHQFVLFQRLRRRMLFNAAGILFRGSALRVVMILLCSVLVWACVFAISWWGFHFIRYQTNLSLGYTEDIVGALFDLFFVALSLMLIFSGSIILYSSLFSSAETAFLLSTPASADQVFAYKFQGAIAFSSWAAILLGSPVLIAYGIVFGAPWFFYFLLPVFFLGFVLLPGSIGALICLLIVNVIPRRHKQVALLAVLLILLGLVLWVGYLVRSAQAERSWTRDAVRNVVTQVASFAQGELLPSHWLSKGLQAAAHGEFLDTSNQPGLLYYLALIWSNSLFLYLLTAWTARRLYRRGYNRVATGGSLRRRYGGAWIDGTLSRLVGFLQPQVRLLIIKDFRTFRRDPVQWAQILIFTGLLCLYFVNTRRFYVYHEDIAWAYQNGISLLNLSATALLLCAWTGRFIYPLLSLEGRKFWILGLLPLRRDLLLWGKFGFSATGALLLAEFLVVLSDLMLVMPVAAIILHILTVAVLAVGLSGLSVGIGAWMPNFRETDPSKIAVGFGGTLNLIASLLFLIVVIGLMAAPWHAFVALNGGITWEDQRVLVGVTLGALAGIALGVAAVVVPLRLGARTFRQMEF